MPQIELALATVLGTELYMFLASRIVHAQLVVGRRTQHIAFVVAQRHVVGMFTVVQGISDVGAVRVALLKRHRHFDTADQRQVQAMGVTRVRPCQS
ncbi:hypothetical protein D3C81_1080700 [compost metagenome]